MIDRKIIKENYSRMTDAALLHLAQTEGQYLTPEALELLHEELLQRQLDTAVFDVIKDDKIALKKSNIDGAKEGASNDFIKAIWVYVFNEKELGISDEEITKGLLARGLDEEHAALIINTIESKTKEILAGHDSDVLRGLITCVIGIAITLWTYSAASNGSVYIIAWGAIVFGIIRFFKGVSSKSRYKTILANMEQERILAAEAANNIEFVNPTITPE